MGISLRKSPPSPNSILPFSCAYLSLFILRPPLHHQEHGGIVPLDGALPQGLAWCPGRGPGTKPSQGGAGCPLRPRQPPWACRTAIWPSVGQNRGGWTPAHTEHHSTGRAFPELGGYCSKGRFPNHSQHFHRLPRSPQPVGEKGMPPL